MALPPKMSEVEALALARLALQEVAGQFTPDEQAEILQAISVIKSMKGNLKMSLNTMSNLQVNNGSLPKITHPQGAQIVKLVTLLDDKKAAMLTKEQVMVKSGDYTPAYIEKSKGNLNADYQPVVQGAMRDILGDKGLLAQMHQSVFAELGAARQEAQAAWNGRIDLAQVSLMVNVLPVKIREFRSLESFKKYYAQADPGTRRAVQLVGGALAKEKFANDPQIGSFLALLKSDEMGEMSTPRIEAAVNGLEEYYFIHPLVRAKFDSHRGALNFSEEMAYLPVWERLAPPARQLDPLTLRWVDAENEWF